MKTAVARVCDCGRGSRTLWFGSDEEGRIVAVGQKMCLISGVTLVSRHSYMGSAFRALVGGKLLTLSSGPGHPTLNVPDKRPVELPSSLRGCYDSCYVPSTRRLFILTMDDLVRVCIDSGEVTLLAEGFREYKAQGRYENILACEDIVVAYRYGLSIWKGERLLLEYRDRAYSFAAILPDMGVVAVEEEGVVDVYDSAYRKVQESKAPSGSFRYVGTVANTIVMVWSSGRELLGAVLQQRDRDDVRLGAFDSSSFLPIPEAGALVMGGPLGSVVVWEVTSHRCVRIPIPVRHSIVGLHWSAQSRTLYAGAKNGKVFALQFPGTADLWGQGEL